MTPKDIFKPKSKKEIDEVISKLDAYNTLQLGINHQITEMCILAFKKAIKNEENLEIDESDLDLLKDYPKWNEVTNEYIQYLEKQDRWMEAIRVSLIIGKDSSFVNNVIDRSNLNFKENIRGIRSERSYADNVIRIVADFTKDLNFVKDVYNHKKIRGNTTKRNEEELLKYILDNTDFTDQLDKILGNNKLVNESVEDILKPKSKEQIEDAQKYMINVFNNMTDFFTKREGKLRDDLINDLSFFFATNKTFILNNYVKNVPEKETAYSIIYKILH